MSFIDALQKTLGNEYNYSRTENGALGYRNSKSALLDMNFRVTSYRDASEMEIVNDFMKAFYEDRLMAMKWLFYARDIRGGLGERRLFRIIFKHLAHDQADYIAPLVPLMGEYGRFDDLMILFDTPLEQNMVQVIKETLTADLDNERAGKPISLMAKWLPSANASSPLTKANAAKVIRALGISEKHYRKMLSRLRKHIGIIETQMSNREWGAINYEAVPSRANLIYNGAFLRNDEARRRQFLASLEKGEVKINASTLYPHDIVHKYMENYSPYGRRNSGPADPAIEGLWKSLPDFVKGDGSTLVVADGSGSMTTTVGNTRVSALTVANALAIYFAERAHGEFANKYITFSNRPQLVHLRGRSLRENLDIALHHSEVASTNIEAVFDLLLRTAINSKMHRNEMPKNILIISDMEFNSAVTNANGMSARLFEQIAATYQHYGYIMPRLVFWNVCSRTKTIPILENEAGIALVSGFSPAIVKMVLSDKLDPYEAMADILNSERYDAIGEALR